MRFSIDDSSLLQNVDAAFADAARRAGEKLVCRAGCAQCCHGAFAIHALDALRLKAGMDALRNGQPALAAEIERRSRRWIAELCEDFPGDVETGRLGDSDAERERFEEFANEAACPALNPASGLCDLYAWRPMTCRVFGPPLRVETENSGEDAFGHCELCFAGASESEVAACEMALPSEQEARLLDEVEQTLGAKGDTIVAFALLK